MAAGQTEFLYTTNFSAAEPNMLQPGWESFGLLERAENWSVREKVAVDLWQMTKKEHHFEIECCTFITAKIIIKNYIKLISQP